MSKDYLEVKDLAKILQSERKSMLYGEWLGPTEEELKLQELAKQYHNLCNSFDCTVCTGISPRTGDAMPVNGYELASVNKNAREVREDIMRQGAAMGFTEQNIVKAIKDYVK